MTNINLFLVHILVACGYIFIRKTCQLSCCGVRYGKTKEILSFLCKLLEISCFNKTSKLIASLLLWWNFLPRPNIMLKTFHICYLSLFWALSNFVDPCWEIYHALKIKMTYTPPNTCYTSTLEVSKNMHFHFYQINTPCVQAWSFSIILVNEAWAMKKYWKEKKGEHMKVHSWKQKKCGHMKVHSKK